MVPLDIDRGRQLLRGVRDELQGDAPALGWSGDDLHELFNAWGFRKLWLWDGYLLRSAPDDAEESMTVPPMDKLGSEILEQAVDLIDRYCRRNALTT